MSVKDTLRDIWAQILQDEADMFSDDDIFFEVGGDSVSAQRLITMAAAQGILLTMEQIFLHASLEEMAAVSQVLQDPEPSRNDDSTALLDNLPSLGSRIQEQRAAISSKYEMAAEQLEDVYPCTPMQQSLVAQDDSSKNDYVRQFVFRLSANTSVDQLQRAWEETVRANPVLRTRIFHLEGTTGYLQAVIDEGMVWSITRTDLVQFLEEDALVPMQPGDLFFRYRIVQKDSTEGAARLHFVWTAHHALCDGFTVPELLEEVSRRYRHETVSLREPFQSFIHSPAINLDWEKMHQFWTRSLSEDNPAQYPSIPAVNDFQANPSAVFKKQLLLDTSGPVRVTRAQMLRGAWAILMAHYTGSEHVGFGVINNGRAAAVEGLSHMTGPTINAVPVVLHVDPQQSVASFLSTIRTQASAMVPFEHSGLSKIREILAGSGYIMDKATTDAAFVPAPDWLKKFHSTESGKTLYRTGDLGKYNPDGSFHIIGRRDTQVKLHGLRIELGEIENQIMTRAHGLVQAAFAALPQTGPCSQHIVAVVCSNLSGLESHSAPVMNLIPSTGSRDSLEKLKTQVSYVLPEYMIPSVWIALEKMPLLISGKIDRRSLKHWIENMSTTEYRKIRAEPEVDAEVDVVPGSTAEKLRQVWSEVLEVPAVTIGLTTSFFSLGGDSIAAIHVVSRAKKAGLPVAVRNIIRTKTLGNLATVVELNATSTSADSGPSNAFHSTDEILKPYQGILQARLAGQPAARIVDAYPTSPFQREIMRQRLRNRPVFLLSWQMEVFSHSSKLSLDGMAVAWRRVVQKYPILRTIFLRDTTGCLPLLQVVLEGAEPHITIASASADEAEPTFETTNTPHVDDCFLPHRVQISQHGERVYVNIELDHQVIDGWSLKLVKSALLDAYEAKDATNLGEAPSYKAFIAAHRPDRVAADNQHWATALRHQRPSLLSLPLSYQEAQKQHNIHKTVIYLPEIKTQSLMEFGVRHGITAASIFDAAWAQTLSAYTGSADVSFEYIVSGRHEDIPDVLDIVGPLINAIPYHLQDVSSEESPFNLAELAQKMQEQRSVDSLHNSSNVREVLEQNLGTSLPFNTALNFQRRPTAVDSAELRVDDHLRKSRDPWHVSCGISRSVFTPQPQDPMGSPAFRPPPNICCTPANDRDPISLTFSSGCYILRTIRPSDPRSSSMPHCLTSSG